jgi:hypothetical protein
MKIYIHHNYQKSIFYKIAHNTANRIYSKVDGNDVIVCEYKGTNFEFVFKPDISFEDDGYHLLDYFTALFYGEYDSKIGKIERDEHYMERESQQILTIYKNLLKDAPSNQKWIITYFRTEKILQTYDTIEHNDKWIDVENLLSDLSNHHIIVDNIFLNSAVESKYSNFHYALTNTIFQWNEIIAIRWFYEFKQVYDKLSFDYDLMYSIKNHKLNRVLMINELSKIKNDRLLLQRSDSLQNPDYDLHSSKIKHINVNSVYGDDDFSDVTWIMNHQGYMDMFFRVLSKAKMQILCESWSWSNKDYLSQYLSEKTFALILAGIPFISTHDYPLKMMELMFNVPPHPFYEQSLKCRANSKSFAKFVESFLENFDENYILCKEWSDLVHAKIMNSITNDNSLLDLLIKGIDTPSIVKKSLI